MTRAIKAMYDLGFIDTTDKQDVHVVRQFKRFDSQGYIIDNINFITYLGSEIDVFTNDIKRGCGSRIDSDLLDAIILNIIDLEMEIKK